MRRYQCIAYDQGGRKHDESIEAASEAEALEHFRKRNFILIEMKEVRKGEEGKGAAPNGKPEKVGGVPVMAILNFYEQLSFLLKSGIPIYTAVRMLSEMFVNKNLSKILKNVLFVLSEGYPLSVALQRYPQHFPSFHTSLINVGETSGNLDEALSHLVDLVKERLEIQRNLFKAAAYPVFLLVLSVCLVVGLLVFIFPEFQRIFASFKVTLPPITLFFISVSEFMRGQAIGIVGGLALSMVGTVHFLFSKSTSGMRDQFFLKIPVVRDVFVSMFVATFSKTFGNLLKAGIPILTALMICKDTIQGKFKEDFFDKVISFVKEGESTSKGMQNSPLIPEMAYQLILVSESTGQIDGMMENIFKFYRKRYSELLTTLTAIVQPVLMFMAAGLIAMVAISLFLPLFKLGSTIRGNG